MSETEFIKYIKKLGIDISPIQLTQLNQYYNLLVSWNEKMNLTSITEKEEVFLKHFYDSLTLCKVIDLKKEKSLCDIGTGAGFPGIVLKIFFPHLKLILVDSLNKRLIFLNEVVKVLNLKNVEIIHARAEEFALKNREKYDVVTARAVAPLRILLEYCIPLVKEKKYFIALKGNENIDDSLRTIDILSGEIDEIISFELPFEKSFRSIIKIKKTRKTDLKYPRRYSDIKKKPL